jgi:branched-chain amino acid transport system substrate-binding protein
VKAMEESKLDSPRGSFALTRSHNPIHDIYLRKVEGGQNKVIAVAVKNLTDPPRGCKL